MVGKKSLLVMMALMSVQFVCGIEQNTNYVLKFGKNKIPISLKALQESGVFQDTRTSCRDQKIFDVTDFFRGKKNGISKKTVKTFIKLSEYGVDNKKNLEKELKNISLDQLIKQMYIANVLKNKKLLDACTKRCKEQMSDKERSALFLGGTGILWRLCDSCLPDCVLNLILQKKCFSGDCIPYSYRVIDGARNKSIFS